MPRERFCHAQAYIAAADDKQAGLFKATTVGAYEGGFHEGFTRVSAWG